MAMLNNQMINLKKNTYAVDFGPGVSFNFQK